MNWFIKGLISSTGFKRNIASVLAMLYGIVSVIPEVQFLTTVLEQIAALFGITGLAQASVAGSLNKAKLASISSVLSVLLFIAQYVPALAPYAPILMKLAAIIGAMGTGVAVANSKKK
jgi:hypothetical protein